MRLTLNAAWSVDFVITCMILALIALLFVLLPLMDHSPIRQTFKLENNFSTVGKSFLNLVKLGSLVAKYCKMSKI